MRGGSSLVSRIFHEWGFYMTDTPGLFDFNNEEGEYENLEFTELNNLLLKNWGGSWHNPVEVPHGMEKECNDLIKKYRKERWGWKDNRTCFTFKAYEKFLVEDSVLFIVVHRDKNSVISSIFSSLGDQVDKGNRNRPFFEELYDKYEKQIDKITKGYNRINVHYEDLIKNKFYNPKLKHF